MLTPRECHGGQLSSSLGAFVVRSTDERRHRLQQVVVWIWIAVVLVITIRAYLQPTRNSVYPILANAARQWNEGSDMYDMSQLMPGKDRFRYAPIVAVGMTPFAALPDAVGGVLWRLLNAAVFLAGILAFTHVVFPGKVLLTRTGLAIIGLLLLPLTIGSLNNAQPNILVVGCLLLGTAALAKQRWVAGAICLAIPVLFKVYPLAVVALLVLVQPRVGSRVGIAIVVGCVAPFACQSPSFAAAAYGSWVEQIAGDHRHALPLDSAYRDFHALARLAGISLEQGPYLTLQLASAALVAILVLRGRRQGWSLERQLRAAFDLGCCWIIVFGPATENCTFALLGPTFALATWEACCPGCPGWKRTLLLAALAMFVGTALAMTTPFGKMVSVGLMPIAGMAVFAERFWTYGLSVWESSGLDTVQRKFGNTSREVIA